MLHTDNLASGVEGVRGQFGLNSVRQVLVAGLGPDLSGKLGGPAQPGAWIPGRARPPGLPCLSLLRLDCKIPLVTLRAVLR